MQYPNRKSLNCREKIWNHRWEFDKGPKEFFNAMDKIIKMGLDFRLALLGENFQAVPKEFIAARERYGDRIVQYGYVGSKQEYREWLMRGSIVVSTAMQENFGISVVEAVRYGCVPILPDRLAYPEIIPDKLHSDLLYRGQDELIEKLSLVIREPSRFQKMVEDLSDRMGDFAWENLIDRYDDELESLVLLSVVLNG